MADNLSVAGPLAGGWEDDDTEAVAFVLDFSD